jgi:hypothetical protein
MRRVVPDTDVESSSDPGLGAMGRNFVNEPDGRLSTCDGEQTP